MDASPPPSSLPRRYAFLAIAVLAFLALWTVTRGWNASILDRHEFRQIQTALSIHWLRETGFKIAYETPLFGPPWSAPMEFPVYQMAVAGLAELLGTGTEPTGRAVSALFFFATLPAVYLLAGVIGLRGTQRFWPVATVMFGPVYLFYARTVMIETTALCFSVWFLYALGRAVRDNSVGFTLAATVFAVLSALAKVTTFIVFAPAAGVLALWFWWPRWQQRRATGSVVITTAVHAAIPVACAFAISVWWVGYSDMLKEANPFAGFLTSHALSPWNWGTLGQRLSPAFWSEFRFNLTQSVVTEGALAVMLVGAVCLTRASARRVALLAALFLLGPLLFSNLYFHHDYYYCASGFFLLFGAGFVFAEVSDQRHLPRLLRSALPLIFFVAQYAGYQSAYGAYMRRELPSPPGIAAFIRDSVPADDVILIYGLDWAGTIPYYAERRAIMIRNNYEDDLESLDEVLSRMAPLRVGAMLVCNPALQRSAEFIRTRTERFGLAPTSLATSATGDLYLPEESLAATLRTVAGRVYPEVTLNVDAGEVNEPDLAEHALAAAILPIFSPAPTRARAMHGFVAGETGGRPSLMAHPVSELHFDAPAGARMIGAEFGLFPDAYAPNAPSVTDGVTVEIIEIRPGGVRRVLFRRHLDPVGNPADRGPQTLNLDAGPFTGPLLFRTTPGPAGRYNNDWAYWGRIEIK